MTECQVARCAGLYDLILISFSGKKKLRCCFAVLELGPDRAVIGEKNVEVRSNTRCWHRHLTFFCLSSPCYCEFLAFRFFGVSIGMLVDNQRKKNAG